MATGHKILAAAVLTCPLAAACAYYASIHCPVPAMRCMTLCAIEPPSPQRHALRLACGLDGSLATSHPRSLANSLGLRVHIDIVDFEPQVRLKGRAADWALVERQVIEAVMADAQVTAREQDSVLGLGQARDAFGSVGPI